MNVHVCHSYTFQQTDCHHSKQALSKHILMKRNRANDGRSVYVYMGRHTKKRTRKTNEIGAVTMTKSTVSVSICICLYIGDS